MELVFTTTNKNTGEIILIMMKLFKTAGLSDWENLFHSRDHRYMTGSLKTTLPVKMNIF